MYGDYYYRKIDLYPKTFGSLDLSKLRLYGCPFGGPVACIRESSKVVLVKEKELVPNVDIYTSSGVLLASFQPTFYKNLVTMGWDLDERLLFFSEDGMIYIYSASGVAMHKKMLEECKEQGIQDAIVWDTGFAVLTKNFQVFVVPDIDAWVSAHSHTKGSRTHKTGGVFASGPSRARQEVLRYKDLPALPDCWLVNKPMLTKGEVELFVSVSGTILVLRKEGSQDINFPGGPYVRMALSPNGKLLACYSERGDVVVWKSDFTRELSSFETKTNSPPKQLVWCGSDAIMAYWESEEEKLLFLIGPEAKFLKYVYHTPVFLTGEMDGLRVISSLGCEYIQRVPSITASIFRIGSMSAAAMLLNAFDLFEKDDPKVDMHIRDIKKKGELVSSVHECVEAAGFEFDVTMQKHLLKAAYFGKGFLTAQQYDSDGYVEKCKILRVLNSIRNAKVGLPLTYLQYLKITPQRLINRLIHRQAFKEARSICNYLNLKIEEPVSRYSKKLQTVDLSSKVLLYWAKSKVASSTSSSLFDGNNKADDRLTKDSQLLTMIVERLKDVPGVDYAEIAREAYLAKRHELAMGLLEFEPDVKKQVPLLTEMDCIDYALSKALQSGNVDLIDYVLWNIKDRGEAEFGAYLYKYPDLFNIWVSIQMEQDPGDLEMFLREELKTEKDEAKRRNIAFKLTCLFVSDAYTSDIEDRRLSRFAEVNVVFTFTQDAFSQKATAEELDLMKEQKHIQAKTSHPFTGLSLNETIHKCIVLGVESFASDLKSKFKIPQKRFAWIKARALAQSEQWDLLRKFSNSAGIGYSPFAEVCLEFNKKTESMEYIKKVEDPAERAILYARAGAWTEALHSVEKMKDPQEILWKLKSSCTNPQVQQAIQEMLQR
uniref:Vacuolar protein sorting-associated protein 16 homolog n=1 Tax=Arcella intermedia TaxID=1963864 RepID=A0A6B2KXJ7_9EUKA